MCVAYKKLTAEEYSNAQKLLQNAKLALQDREKKLAEVYEKIERDFILLGATAVEDRLVHFLVSYCCGLTQQLATQPLTHPSPPAGWGGEMDKRGNSWVEIKTV